MQVFSTYNRANSAIIKNAMILNIIHNIFKRRETDVYKMYNITSIKDSR